MVNHDIVRLHIAVHDAHRVAVVQGLQQLVQIETNVKIGQSLVQLLEVRVVHVLKDERWRA